MQRPCLERTFRTAVAGEEVFSRAWTGGDHARGRPIVMVHGIGASSRYMVPLAQRLAERTDVYAIDLPGFGQSTKPARAWSTERLADTLGRWIDAVELSAPILLGNSYGCQVAVDLAARRPAVAAALVLNSPTVDASHRSMLGEIGRLLLDAPRERWPLVALNARDYLRAGAGRSLATLRFAIADRIEDTIPRVPIPILIVRGARDPIVSDAWAQHLAELAPAASVIRLDGAPHAANFSAPDAFARAIGSFLALAGA